MLQVLREDQHAARCWLVPHLGGTSWEERGGAAVGLWHVVQVKLHCDLRGVSSPRMPFRAAVAAVKVRVKGLTRRVAEEAQALVQLHQAPAIIQLLWQVGPQQLQQPVCQLLAVNDDSVAVPHFWHELLLAVANVEQGRCEALGIHLRKERRALFLSQGTPQHPREAAPGPCVGWQRKVLHPHLAASHGRGLSALRGRRLTHECGRLPMQLRAVWVIAGSEHLAHLPVGLVEPRRLQGPASHWRQDRGQL
mmetsp:Transcript_11338/g.30944  ORF Transcript_11338/g.30944 Transcript_11338/m.30944 type:complete len:250 (-) Transcript_11338:163-912(-)